MTAMSDLQRTALVRAGGPGASRGTLTFADRIWVCVLGRTGVTSTKREGDGATPAGLLPIRQVLWRADRLARPATARVALPIARDDGWCDAPEDAAYNRPVRHPYPASAEHLWREDHLYDLIVVLGWNDAPVVPGRGSAIFLHVAGEGYPPTAGCVAMALADLLDVLALVPEVEALRVEGA